LLDKVKEYMKLNNMLEPGDAVVVGVSGGADSMCLLSVLLELGIKVYVVHINHMLRGNAADDDMHYVESFCQNRGIKCYTFSYDVEKLAEEKRISCEEAGRMVRYEAFDKVLQETGSSRIAVAHNAGDNAETILHNLFRGTGIKGLGGIVPVRGRIIRPLLCVERSEIEEYLKERKLEFRLDATNAEDIYTRNRIRNTVLTYVKENINVNAVRHINMTGQMLEEIDEFVTFEGDKRYKECVTDREEGLYIVSAIFDTLHPVMKKYIIRKSIGSITGSLKDITFTHIANVLDLFSNDVGKSVNLPYGIVAKRSYEGVVLGQNMKNSDKMTQDAAFTSIEIRNFGEFLVGESGEKLVVSPFSKKQWDELKNKYEEKIYTKWLDCDILKRNLVIRTRRKGDFIIVDNNGSRKKIKDLFIDLKIPKEQRDKVLLLADGNEIVWIIGHRINYNFRVIEDTKEITRLEYLK